MLTVVMSFSHSYRTRRGDTTPEAVLLVQEHSSRIKEWWISTDSAALTAQLSLVNAVNLESLILDIDFYGISYNPVLFPESLPSLQKLTLIRAAPSMLIPSWLHNVKKLSFINSPRGVTLMHLITLLGNCHQLESLDLINLDSAFSYIPADQPKVARLPTLQHFHMILSEEQSTYILDRIELPDSVCWDICCTTLTSFVGPKLIPQNLPIIHTSPYLMLQLGRTSFKVMVGTQASFSTSINATGRSLAFMERCFQNLHTLIPTRLPTVPEVQIVLEDERPTLPATNTWYAFMNKMQNLQTLKFVIGSEILYPYEIQRTILAFLNLFIGNIHNLGYFTEFKILELVGFHFGERANDFIDLIADTITDCTVLYGKLELRIRKGQDLRESTVTRLGALVTVVVSD